MGSIMPNWLKAVLDWVKLKPAHLFGIAIVCFVVVGLPKSLQQFLGYKSIIDPYRGWISLTGLICGVYGLVISVVGLKRWILEKWRNWQFEKNAKKKLMKLHQQEKRYLAEYLKKDVSSLKFRLSNGVINGLVAKDVLYRASQIASSGDIFPFNIQPWVLNAIEQDDTLKSHILEHADQENLEARDYY